MPAMKRIDSLDISEDMDFQRKEWAAGRWGWFFMVIVAIAALLGLFGQGPLSDASVENGGLRVQYGRFERVMAASQFTVEVSPASVQNGEIRLQLGQGVLEVYDMENIIPEPERVELSRDAYTYVFKAGQADRLPVIIFNLKANRFGFASGQIRLENGPAVQLRQFIYP